MVEALPHEAEDRIRPEGVTASGAMAYGGRMHPQLCSDSGYPARVGR
jgi:hypothetical protein